LLKCDLAFSDFRPLKNTLDCSANYNLL